MNHAREHHDGTTQLMDVPQFPPPDDKTPKKKPRIALTQLRLSIVHDACLRQKKVLCVVYIPETTMASPSTNTTGGNEDPSSSVSFRLDRIKHVAKQFRRDPVAFFWVNPSHAWVTTFREWIRRSRPERSSTTIMMIDENENHENTMATAAHHDPVRHGAHCIVFKRSTSRLRVAGIYRLSSISIYL